MWHSIALARSRRATVTAAANATNWQRCYSTRCSMATLQMQPTTDRQYLFTQLPATPYTIYTPFTAASFYSSSCCSSIRAFSSSAASTGSSTTSNVNWDNTQQSDEWATSGNGSWNVVPPTLPPRPLERTIEELLFLSVSTTIEYAQSVSDYIRALTEFINYPKHVLSPEITKNLELAPAERERARTELAELFLHLWVRYVAPHPAFNSLDKHSSQNENLTLHLQPSSSSSSPSPLPRRGPPLYVLAQCIDICRDNQLAEQGLLFTSLLIDAAKKAQDTSSELSLPPMATTTISTTPRRAFHLQSRTVRSAILCARYNPHLVYTDERAAWNSVIAILSDMRNFPQYFRLDQSIFHALFIEQWDTHHTPTPPTQSQLIHGISPWIHADTGGKNKKLSGGFPLVLFNTLSPHVRLFAEVLIPYLERMKMAVRVGLQDKGKWNELKKRLDDVWKHATLNHTVSANVTKQHVQASLLSSPLLQHHQLLHLRETLQQRATRNGTSSNAEVDRNHLQEVYDSFRLDEVAAWTALQNFMCPRTVEDQVNRCNDLLLSVLKVCKTCKLFNAHPQALFVHNHITVTPDTTAIVLQAILDVMELLSQPIPIKSTVPGTPAKKRHTDPQEKLGFIQTFQWGRLEELMTLQLQLGELAENRIREQVYPLKATEEEQKALLRPVMNEVQLARVKDIYQDIMRVRKKLYKQIGKEVNDAKNGVIRSPRTDSTPVAAPTIVSVTEGATPASAIHPLIRSETILQPPAEEIVSVEPAPSTIDERFLAEIAPAGNPPSSVVQLLQHFESVLRRFKQQGSKISTTAPFDTMLGLLLKQNSKSPVSAAALTAALLSSMPNKPSPSSSFLLMELFFQLCHRYGIPLSTREFHHWFAHASPRSSDESIAIVALLEHFGLDADRKIFRSLASILSQEMLDSVRAHAKLEVLLQHMEIVRETFDAEDYNFILNQLMGPAAGVRSRKNTSPASASQQKQKKGEAVDQEVIGEDEDEQDEEDLPILHEQSLIEWAERASLAGLWDALDPHVQLAVIAAVERSKSDSQQKKPLPLASSTPATAASNVAVDASTFVYAVSEAEAHPVPELAEAAKPFVCCMQSGEFEFGQPGFNFSIRSFFLSHTCPNFVQCQTLASAKAAAAAALAPALGEDQESTDRADR